MTYTVVENKKVLGSFDELANAELFAKAYTETTGTEVQVVNPTKKATAPIPELDPIIFGKEKGIKALREKLQSMTMEELKAIIKLHGMDPFRTYRNSKSIEKLVAGMISNAEIRIGKGESFRHYEG